MRDLSAFLLSSLKEIQGEGEVREGCQDGVRKTAVICLLPTEFRFSRSDPSETGDTGSPEVFHQDKKGLIGGYSKAHVQGLYSVQHQHAPNRKLLWTSFHPPGGKARHWPLREERDKAGKGFAETDSTEIGPPVAREVL